MDDRLEALETGGIGKQGGSQLLAIDPAISCRAGKRRLDAGYCRALVELVHLGVGVANGDPQCAQTCSDGGFAHADTAGEPNDQHQWPSISATTRARSSSVTWGATPNHFSKPGVA